MDEASRSPVEVSAVASRSFSKAAHDRLKSVLTITRITHAGAGGSPLVDLLTGKVIGMSYAGKWQGERGKFAYSEPIPAAAVAIIMERLGGETEDELPPEDKAPEAKPLDDTRADGG